MQPRLRHSEVYWWTVSTTCLSSPSCNTSFPSITPGGFLCTEAHSCIINLLPWSPDSLSSAADLKSQGENIMYAGGFYLWHDQRIHWRDKMFITRVENILEPSFIYFNNILYYTAKRSFFSTFAQMKVSICCYWRTNIIKKTPQNLHIYWLHCWPATGRMIPDKLSMLLSLLCGLSGNHLSWFACLNSFQPPSSLGFPLKVDSKCLRCPKIIALCFI